MTAIQIVKYPTARHFSTVDVFIQPQITKATIATMMVKPTMARII